MRIKPVAMLRVRWPFDAIGVKRGAVQLGHRDANVPDAARLVRRMLKAKLEDGFGGLLLRIAQQRDAGGVSRVEREVESTLRLDPLDAERPRATGWHGTGFSLLYSEGHRAALFLIISSMNPCPPA